MAQLRRQQLAAALAATETDGRGPQDAKTDKSIGFTWEAHVARLDEAEFKRRYRLTAESFYALHDKLEPHKMSNMRSFSNLQPLAGSLRHMQYSHVQSASWPVGW